MTYVCQQSGRIAGYYALAAATIRREWSPDDFAAHRPRSIPCMLLARLAVDRRVQGQGVGATLLLDALRRTFAASDQFGIAALLIHCKDEHARDFYTHHVDALVSPIAPMTLILSKLTPYLVLSLVNLAMILTLSATVLRVPIAGSLPLLIAESLLFILTPLRCSEIWSCSRKWRVRGVIRSFRPA